MCKKTALLAATCLLILPAHAGATQDQTPFKVHLTGVPHAARGGEAFRDVLRLEAGRSCRVADLHLVGDGWNVGPLPFPADRELEGGEVIDLELVATPVDPERPLELSCSVDGEPWTRTFDLSPATASRARPGAARRLSGGMTPWEPLADHMPFASQRTDALLEWAASAPEPDPPVPGIPRRTITITGSVGYYHGVTHEYVPASNIVVLFYAWNENGGPPFPQVSSTNWSGEFSYDFDWQFAGDPNLAVEFCASDAHVEVEETDIWEDTWAWTSPVAYGVEGSSCDFGQLLPTTEEGYGALNVLTATSRTWHYLYWNVGYDTPHVEVQWPEPGSTSFYRPFFEEMHITGGDSYNEATISHEYGHHWVENFAYNPSMDYCNGICDFDGCGHCLWCEEDQEIAWGEGVPNFISALATRYMESNFVVPAQVTHLNFQSLACDCDGQCYPQWTEGFFDAVLWDMADIYDLGEDDPFTPGFTDRMADSQNLARLFETFESHCEIAGHRPHTAWECLECFREAYPELAEDFWETAMNNAFDIDIAPPGTVGNLYANDHEIGVLSPDNTLAMCWDRAPDEASGVDGYSILISVANPAPPDLTKDIGDETFYLTDPLAPGTYYFNIRAVDRSGRWAEGYVAAGPYLIREAEPADLEHYQPAGWDYPLVPRNDDTATHTVAEVSNILNGNTENTFWNVAYANGGEAPTSGTFRVGLLLDGELIDQTSHLYLGGGNHGACINQGPVTIPGGRHTLGMFIDCEESLAEPTEVDNYWATQFVWTPETLSNGELVERAAPPLKTAGHEHIHNTGHPIYNNCDGLRMNETPAMMAIWAHPTGLMSDYNLHLYNDVAWPDSGFGGPPIAWSTNEGGMLDAVLVNPWNAGIDRYNVAVYNSSADDFTYRAQHLVGAYLGLPEAAEVTWNEGEMMYLRSFYHDEQEAITVTLTNETGPQPIHLAYFDPDFGAGGLWNADEDILVTTGETAVLDIVVPGGSYGGLAVYRDPIYGTGPLSFTLTHERTLPDLVAAIPEGWHGNFTPQPNASLDPQSDVPAPPRLRGDVDSTYLYMSELNASPAVADEHVYEVLFDGFDWYAAARPELAGNEERRWRSTTPVTVPAGRHTLVSWIDRGQDVDELWNDNNVFGEQWAWIPNTLICDHLESYESPTLRFGGHELISQGRQMFNCSGLRTRELDSADGGFAAVYVAGRGNLDVDLRLHPALDDPVDAFGLYHAASTWTGLECEFVITNLHAAAGDQFDAGIVRRSGSAFFDAQITQSDDLEGAVVGSHGPFTMARNDMIDLYEVPLEAGIYEFVLNPEPTDVDLGFSLSPATDIHCGKTDIPEDCIAWLGEPGEPETFTATVIQPLMYCLAVWRVASIDGGTEQTYRIVIRQISTAADLPSDRPEATRLVGALPNPCRPPTRLHFDLAQPADARVIIYDVRGAVVRHLLADRLPVGRHDVLWNGRDDRDRRVSRGIYFASLRAGSERSRLKLMVIR